MKVFLGIIGLCLALFAQSSARVREKRQARDYSHLCCEVVPDGDEPCPESQRRCCNGFIFFSPVGNCVGFSDFRDLIDIFSRNPGLTFNQSAEGLPICSNGLLYFPPVYSCVNITDFRELVDIYVSMPGLAALFNPVDSPLTCRDGLLYFQPFDKCVNLPDFRKLVDTYTRFRELFDIYAGLNELDAIANRATERRILSMPDLPIFG